MRWFASLRRCLSLVGNKPLCPPFAVRQSHLGRPSEGMYIYSEPKKLISLFFLYFSIINKDSQPVLLSIHTNEGRFAIYFPRFLRP